MLFGVAGSLEQNVEGDVQIDGDAVPVNPVDVVEMAWCAAACRDDGVVELAGVVQHELFQFAECLFSIFVEEDGNGGVVVCLKLLVEVNERVSQFVGEAASDGGLAAIHVANEVDAHGRGCLLFVCGLTLLLGGWGGGLVAASDGDQRVGFAGIAGKDAKGSLHVAIYGGWLGDELHQAGGIGYVLQIAVAVGGDGFDVERVLVDIVFHFVGVA